MKLEMKRRSEYDANKENTLQAVEISAAPGLNFAQSIVNTVQPA